ncbi:6-bladed beta-propeller [Paraprevotella xylaniphila]|uniref:6-bladed beta-propeller n=1 Tax=Paraprevotella xylaniphila TaxID=454155 RepID=UPI003AB64766
MNKRHFLLLCIFCLCACCRQKGGAIIDLTGIGQKELVVPAESIYSSIKFIPLETHEKSILSSPNVFGMDGDNVLVWDQDEILRFDTHGKFLNRVGRLGRGTENTGVSTPLIMMKKRKESMSETWEALSTNTTLKVTILDNSKYPRTTKSSRLSDSTSN